MGQFTRRLEPLKRATEVSGNRSVAGFTGSVGFAVIPTARFARGWLPAFAIFDGSDVAQAASLRRFVRLRRVAVRWRL